MPPMAAGLFGYLGYDMVRHMERLPEPNPDTLGVPDAIMIRPTMMVVFDAVRDEISLVTPVPDGGDPRKAAYEGGLARIEEVAFALERPCPSTTASIRPRSGSSRRSRTRRLGEFEAMVARAKEYIRAGDIFQVVLSQRFEAEFPLPAFALYRSLRRVNPAPFLCYLDFRGFPDRLLDTRDPGAGPRRQGDHPADRRHAPRGATPPRTAPMPRSLLADPKERAEHLMLLDLGRNDVGRVSAMGTVEVTDCFSSNTTARSCTSSRTSRAASTRSTTRSTRSSPGFPAGTVSGAPKVRAMEIIDELEKEKRGPYAGCIGYFGANGEMDTCIVLRTALVKDGRMSVQAGAGIVYDSDPEAEQKECVNKAKALFARRTTRCASPAAHASASERPPLCRSRERGSARIVRTSGPGFPR